MMENEPWFDLPAEPRRRGCGCSRRMWIILMLILLIVLSGCLASKLIMDRYQARQRLWQQQSTPIVPPPLITPVVIPPAGGQIVPTVIKSPSG